MNKVIPTRIGPVIEVDDGYVTMYRMEKIALYASKDLTQKPVREYDIDVLSKIKELRDEAMANKITFVKYIYGQVTASPIDEKIIEDITSVLFDEDCYAEYDTFSGPAIHYRHFYLDVAGDGKLEMVMKDTNELIAKSIAPIYEKVGESALPRVVCFQTIADMVLESDRSLAIYYLLRTDLIDQFTDYIKQTTKDAGVNAIYEDKFSSVCEEPANTNITYGTNEIRINQGGRVFVIQGGDGIALEIHGETITVSRKGMRKDVAMARSIEEAASKITSRIAEVMKPCGEKAKVVYVEKIKPTVKDFSKKTAQSIKDSYKEMQEQEHKDKEKGQVKPQRKPDTKFNESGESESTKYVVLLSAIMTFVVVLLLFVGGC